MTTINDPITLPCGVTLPNRLFKSAMTEGLATPLGHATEAHATLYRRWAEGGVGTLVTGNVMVDYRYLERAGNIVIDGNGGEAELARLAKAGTSKGNQLWMQISHPGRQCTKFANANPVAPSDVGLNVGGLFGRPRALRSDEIRTIIGKYAHVAKVAKAAGFTGVQIHGAHGYLISQFLSPRTNQRTDEWGGSLENRARLLLETVRAVRAAVGPEYPVSVKLNSADFSKNGFSLEESCLVAQWLDKEGLDLLEISGGTYEDFKLLDGSTRKSDSTLAREAYFIDYAKQIRDVVKMPLAITGGFRSRSVMDEALGTNQLDVIGIARPTCAMPDAGAQLLANPAFKLPEYEANLRLGRGWFGPFSSNNLMKTLNVQAAVSWFYQQIVACAAGKPMPDQSGLFKAYILYYWREIGMAIARRRALKAKGLGLK